MRGSKRMLTTFLAKGRMQRWIRVNRFSFVLCALLLFLLYTVVYSNRSVKWFHPPVANTDSASSLSMASDDVVSVDWLDKHKDSVVLLDATYDMQPKPDFREFKEKYYGKFEELMKMRTSFSEAYAKEHIPGATHFDVNAAYYPSQYIRFDLYPPQEFEKYVRLLGINAGDHIVIYARGPAAGMLWAARAWWSFKAYGHEKVSVLNGGLDAWKKAGKPVTSDVVVVTPGNWKAKPINKSWFISYEELDESRPGRRSLFEDLSKVNYLDARAAPLFDGSMPLDIPARGASGNHLKGAKNVPLSAVIGADGVATKEQVERALENAGYDPSKPIITACNGGVQASLLALALKHAGKQARVYNGSMFEIAARAPELISEKK